MTTVGDLRFHPYVTGGYRRCRFQLRPTPISGFHRDDLLRPGKSELKRQYFTIGQSLVTFEPASPPSTESRNSPGWGWLSHINASSPMSLSSTKFQLRATMMSSVGAPDPGEVRRPLLSPDWRSRKKSRLPRMTRCGARLTWEDGRSPSARYSWSTRNAMRPCVRGRW